MKTKCNAFCLVFTSLQTSRSSPDAEIIKAEITATHAGTVSEAKVVDASPKEIFGQAVLEAIRRWRFKPAFKDGHAVARRGPRSS